MGKERCVYSWRLDHNDATPKGKRRALSLREMEKKIQADHFEQIATNGGNMTVLELVEKYTSTKTGVRPTTVAGYGTVINLLKKDPFGKRRIDRVRISDAKCWLIHLQYRHISAICCNLLEMVRLDFLLHLSKRQSTALSFRSCIIMV